MPRAARRAFKIVLSAITDYLQTPARCRRRSADCSRRCRRPHPAHSRVLANRLVKQAERFRALHRRHGVFPDRDFRVEDEALISRVLFQLPLNLEFRHGQSLCARSVMIGYCLMNASLKFPNGREHFCCVISLKGAQQIAGKVFQTDVAVALFRCRHIHAVKADVTARLDDAAQFSDQVVEVFKELLV